MTETPPETEATPVDVRDRYRPADWLVSQFRPVSLVIIQFAELVVLLAIFRAAQIATESMAVTIMYWVVKCGFAFWLLSFLLKPFLSVRRKSRRGLIAVTIIITAILVMSISRVVSIATEQIIASQQH
jgi:hypothetical protein